MAGGTQDARGNPVRAAALAASVSGGGGLRRMFIDATGTPVPPPNAIRAVVATDDVVTGLLRELGAPVVGWAVDDDAAPPPAALPPAAPPSAGKLSAEDATPGTTSSATGWIGPARRPDPAAVAALNPDVIITGAVDRRHDLAEPSLLAALRRVAPVIAVDTARPVAARADLRALLGDRAGPPG